MCHVSDNAALTSSPVTIARCMVQQATDTSQHLQKRFWRAVSSVEKNPSCIYIWKLYIEHFFKCLKTMCIAFHIRRSISNKLLLHDKMSAQRTRPLFHIKVQTFFRPAPPRGKLTKKIGRIADILWWLLGKKSERGGGPVGENTLNMIRSVFPHRRIRSEVIVYIIFLGQKQSPKET